MDIYYIINLILSIILIPIGVAMLGTIEDVRYSSNYHELRKTLLICGIACITIGIIFVINLFVRTYPYN